VGSAVRFLMGCSRERPASAYRQVVRRGTDAYIVIGDPDPVHTGFTPRLAIKLVRVL
jgi:hypothetical protein